MPSDHPHGISITPHRGRVVVRFAGHPVVDTTRALDLAEGAMPTVLYVPRADADLSAFEASSRRTRCPFKGEAAYFTLKADGREAQNAVWSYEDPLPAVREIAGHLAFYADQVEIRDS